MAAKPGLPQKQLTPVSDTALRDAIVGAISDFDISDSGAWKKLDTLSSNTEVETIEANTEGIFVAGPKKFEATATVYVVLHYGDKKDSFETTDAFPAHVTGRFDDNKKVIIENFSVDTSSFFDGDA